MKMSGLYFWPTCAGHDSELGKSKGIVVSG